MYSARGSVCETIRLTAAMDNLCHEVSFTSRERLHLLWERCCPIVFVRILRRAHLLERSVNLARLTRACPDQRRKGPGHDDRGHAVPVLTLKPGGAASWCRY